MQLMPRYLVSNRITIVADLAGFVTEYRQVYSRQVKVYRGIDNVLQFKLVNADQKAIDTTGYIPKFIAIDDDNFLAIEKDGVVADDGSTAPSGLFTVTLTESDLTTFDQQYLRYNIYLEDVNTQNILTYSHSNFDNDATIFVDTRVFPSPRPSVELTDFTQDTLSSVNWLTSAVDINTGVNGIDDIVTMAFYTDGYVGDIVVQATLDPQVTEGTTWVDFETVIFDGTETTPTPLSIEGIFSFIRFKAVTSNPNPTITKILVRN